MISRINEIMNYKHLHWQTFKDDYNHHISAALDFYFDCDKIWIYYSLESKNNIEDIILFKKSKFVRYDNKSK